MMRYYKVLNSDGSCSNGGKGKWRLPKKEQDGTWTPGKWMPEIEGELVPCKNGYHICREGDLVGWLGEAIFEVEYRGEMMESEDKLIVRQARLLRKLESWNKKTARLFAADYAEHVLHLYEKQYPADDRPRKAIQAARDYAEGVKDDLTAAAVAAWEAAEAAAVAAWEAEEAAGAGVVAQAAWEAYLAAWAAAYSATLARAARAPAVVREHSWQTKRLFEYLEE